MKYFEFYKDRLGCNNIDEVFDYLINNLKPSNTLWSYFVNWNKVIENAKKVEVALNTLNYLIGKQDFDEEFRYIIKNHPEVVGAIPALVVRDGKNRKKFKILVEYERKKLLYEDYDFSIKNPTNEDIETYLAFMKGTGLKELIVSQRIKNFVDYMVGVEAGLDSNGRKNRSGHAMENIIEIFVEDVCNKNGYRYLKDADYKKIYNNLDYSVPVDKSSRRYDFVIDNGKELFIVETNFYGGGGSKLKSTAGEYRNLYDVLKRDKYKFIWITDGYGWKITSRPLRETFDYNDYLFSLAMVEKGVLDDLLKQAT